MTLDSAIVKELYYEEEISSYRKLIVELLDKEGILINEYIRLKRRRQSFTEIDKEIEIIRGMIHKLADACANHDKN